MFYKFLFFMLCLIIWSNLAFAEITVEIVEPMDGAKFQPCQDIPLRANITTDGEEIRAVYFFANGASKGTARQEPWETDRWTDVSTGNYMIQARALDIDRNQIWSEPIHIKVGDVSNGDLISNGDFSCGDTEGWTLNICNEGTGEITLMDDGYFDDLYYVLYESEQATTDWFVQFSQTVPVDSGHVYDIYFYADSDDPRPVTVGFQEPRDPYRTHVWQTVEIDGADEYRLEGGIAQFTDEWHK